MEYAEDDFLMVSDIQHFVYCQRQWALITIEHQWHENSLTADGRFHHQKADNPEIKEKRGNLEIVRAMPIHSRELGLTGICDVVEFYQDDNGTEIFGKKGKYLPIPVEYKHGKSKLIDCDRMQVLAEAVCLEEMLDCEIPYGYLYYMQTRHREKVVFTSEMRERLKEIVQQMHQYWERKYTPVVKPSSKCKNCSLADICLPKLQKIETVSSYINRKIRE